MYPLMTPYRPGIRMAGNAGLVATTAVGVGDLCHTLSISGPRTARLVKIMCYNNTGANATIIFGTLTNAGAWAPRLPTMMCLNTFDNIWTEFDIPNVEFVSDTQAGALGTTGNIHVVGSVALMLVSIELEEFGG